MRPRGRGNGLVWAVAIGALLLASHLDPTRAADAVRRAGDAVTESRPAVPAASPMAARAVAYARAQLGDPYVWGADGPDAWDCSGLTGAAWRHAGLQWPDMTAAGQWQWLADRHRGVTRSQLEPGDLVFYGAPITHVAIYTGHGRMVEAQQPGVPVHEVPLRTEGWAGAARPGT
jgi:cell wall-associated NlpC family hydrolase